MIDALYLIIAATIILILVIISRTFFKNYFKWHGKRIVTCPATQQAAAVQVDSKHAAITVVTDVQDIRLNKCSNWPERENCDQACLTQIEAAPENCLARSILEDWFSTHACYYCGKAFEQIHWHDHKPALLSPEKKLVEWEEIAIEALPTLLETHMAVCWNCLIIENFRKQHPELITKVPKN